MCWHVLFHQPEGRAAGCSGEPLNGCTCLQVLEGKLTAGQLSTFIILALFVGGNIAGLASTIAQLVQASCGAPCTLGMQLRLACGLPLSCLRLLSEQTVMPACNSRLPCMAPTEQSGARLATQMLERMPEGGEACAGAGGQRARV